MMSEMDRLRAIMARLRSPDGCPWDREQTLESLATFVLEETHEVLEAITSGSAADLREELGDLLFQIVFQARVAEERGDFDLEDVMRSIGDKIVRRHPHVFGEGRLSTSEQVLKQWERIKVEERKGARDGSIFAGVPTALPALLKALRVSTKAGRVGFDWAAREELMRKVDEELAELRAAFFSGRPAEVEEELGDLLFTLANVFDHLVAGPVDERDARLDDPNRAAVRIAPRDRGVRVHHGRDPCRDETFGRDPVEVPVVDHRDVAGLEPLDEVLGAAIDAGRTDHRGRGAGAATPGHGSSHA